MYGDSGVNHKKALKKERKGERKCTLGWILGY
jgi:hypothetical protein